MIGQCIKSRTWTSLCTRVEVWSLPFMSPTDLLQSAWMFLIFACPSYHLLGRLKGRKGVSFLAGVSERGGQFARAKDLPECPSRPILLGARHSRPLEMQMQKDCNRQVWRRDDEEASLLGKRMTVSLHREQRTQRKSDLGELSNVDSNAEYEKLLSRSYILTATMVTMQIICNCSTPICIVGHTS